LEPSRPKRVLWDVDFRGRTGRTKRIARHIREASPGLVELRIEGDKGLSELPAIYAEIHKCNPRIVATVRLFPGAAPVAQRGYSMDFIWEVDAFEPFRGMLPPGAEAVSFTPDEDTLDHLPDVVEEFAESCALALHLPNVNALRALAEVGHVPVPLAGQLQETAEAIFRLSPPLEGKKLVIHDYFLWKLLRAAFPAEMRERFEFSACEAASALAYVDWEGSVYPCDSLPIRLGNLQDSTFERIWRAPARMQLLDAIRARAASCGECDYLESCLSGCRGLASTASGGNFEL
jgi:radical SAM protein with 4Fe4S-binding SPASM domain